MNDPATRIYQVSNQLFKNATDATAYAYQANQKVIQVYQHPLKKPLNRNRIPLIPTFQQQYLTHHLEHVATYRQSGTSTLYFAIFKGENGQKLRDNISF